jgi:predicted solute-binding protein/REP element-mobilizing transposase RayT
VQPRRKPSSPAREKPRVVGRLYRLAKPFGVNRSALQTDYLNSLRIGCVKYLNAGPLIRGWPGHVELDHPSALCKRLANGELDVALVSSFEFLRNPIYRIVDDVSISSDGPVYSVVVAHRGDISDVNEIELDAASQTAVNLLRCLLGELVLGPRLIRNIDLQSVRPAGLQPAAAGTAQAPAFRALDRDADIQRTRRNLPHWKQEGATHFVTFRLADAVPAQLAKQWREELETWRRFHPEPWDGAAAAEYRKRFLQPREDWLDLGHGSCLLRDSRAAIIVANALRFFDGQRYHLDVFVVMPNHVHVLVQPLAGFHLSEIVHSWKSYTARQINKVLGHSGTVWMQESFDRIVRDWDALLRCRAYIARNPEKARLRSGEFILSTVEKLRNINLQSVHPAGLQPGGCDAAENISAGRTGNMPMFPTARRTRLLIGDQAIRFRQNHANEFEFWDLGAQWKKLVGLPFVYALWLIRPEVADAKQVADRLRALRDKNLGNLDELIAEVVAGVADSGHPKLDRQFLVRYYREHLRFSFGGKEKEGLRTFASLCAKHGLLSHRDLELNLA